VRVIVMGQLPREAHNAPLHLFSASPELVDFASTAFQRRSEYTSSLLERLFERLGREGLAMPYTMADFQRDYVKEHFAKLTPEEQRAVWQSLPARNRVTIFESLPVREQEDFLQLLPPEKQAELLQSLPPEMRLAGLSAEQIREYLERLTTRRPAAPRKPRRKKQ
jgi:hypothetical protein